MSLLAIGITKNVVPPISEDREVIRCVVCGLVQFRTRNGNCRKCLVVPLPPPPIFVLPEASPDSGMTGENRDDKRGRRCNYETVENVGERVREIRESFSLTQRQAEHRVGVTRSHFSRIEHCKKTKMRPSLGVLEKIATKLGISMNRFFLPEDGDEGLFFDPFVREVAEIIADRKRRLLTLADRANIIGTIKTAADA